MEHKEIEDLITGKNQKDFKKKMKVKCLFCGSIFC
jgi:hypothetical protein